jgi:glycosidase
MVLRSTIALACVLAGALAPLSGGCGDSDASNRDYGAPPNASNFDPGSGGNDPYGYGSKGASTVDCPAELKRCGYTVTYPFNGESSVELRGDFGGPDTWVNGKPMTKQGSIWTVDILVPLGKPIQFKFLVNGTTWKIDETQPTATDANNNTNNTFAGKTCSPAVCEEEGQLPPGVFDWRDSVIYFVFVDRFYKSGLTAACPVPGVSGAIADYEGGDWPGVTQKINDGYFNDLGVNTLWITVPVDNPDVTGKGTDPDNHQYSAYHGYWPKMDNTDPAQLAPESCFGTLNDLKALVAAAHAKGLKVLFDYAMVHVHSSSQIFALHNDWFWPNSKDGSSDCICGHSCSWVTDAQRCWFADYLPHWNYTNAAARSYSVANAVAWITQTQDASGNGADGFRADAIKHVDTSWLTDLRVKINTDVTAKQSPPQRFYMVGETYEWDNRDLLKSFIDPATKLDGQFDFPLRDHLVKSTLMRTTNMSDLASFMDTNDYFYGASSVMSTFIGNHDLPRAIHLAANNRLWGDDPRADGKTLAWQNQPDTVVELEAYERLANGFAVLFTNRGAPLVYYGDEIGMPGAGDPDNRRFMQWTPLSPNQTYLRDRLKALADIRSKHPALRRGIRSTIGANADTWTYVRTTTGDTVYVAINRSDSPQQVSGLPAGPLDDLLGGQTATGPSLTVPPRQTRIFVAK